MATTTNSVKQPNYIRPFIFMVILMALIGFITGLNQQFQEPLKQTFLEEAGQAKNTFSTLLIFVFFLAYFIIGPVAARYLNKQGYKSTLLRGILYVAGAMLVFEASVLLYDYIANSQWIGLNHIAIFQAKLPLSYFIFLVGSFMCGSGLTFLQASVNPYIVVSTVPGTTGVTRQNIAGVGNSIMTTFTPFFVANVIFNGRKAEELSVDAMVIPFVVLFALVVLLYIGVRQVKLPHLEGTTSKQTEQSLRKTVLRYRHLVLGTVAIGVYVGCEVCVGANMVNAWGDAFRSVHPNASGSELSSVYATAAMWCTFYWGAMLLGRFLSSFLAKVSARNQLAFTTIIAAILVIVSMSTNALRILIGVGLMHSVMWGAIYALALEGLGKYTALGSGILLMGLIGGAILPLLQSILADLISSWNYTWLLVIAGELYMLYYALWGSKVIQPAGLNSLNTEIL